MSVGYVSVQWTGFKKVYDLVLAAGILLYLAVFVAVGVWRHPGDAAISGEILVLRALGSCAFVLLTLILCLGPLARLNRRALPLLYNRRHLGVATFAVAAAHGVLSLGYYHGFGVLNPLVSLLVSNPNYGTLSAFPFQPLGAAALVILFVMAATSHDFWNRNLGPGVWKALHMLVYPAYALVVMHVALGALQTPRGAPASGLVGAAVLIVAGLHLGTGWREFRRDRGRTAGPGPASPPDGWVDAGAAADVPLNAARVVSLPGGERVAIFRHAEGLSAVSNVCRHQGGPLGEGRILDGCITCPWHGWTYRPTDGCAPPPFLERISTYRLRIVAGRVWIDPRALPPGTPVPPVPG